MRRPVVDLTPSTGRKSTTVPAWAVAGATAAVAPAALRALPTKPNWRGEDVPFPAGLIPATIGTLTAAGPTRLLNAGVAVLGLIDDLADAAPRGFDAAPRGVRGHARAAMRGRPTSGHLKAAGTAALALATTRDPLQAAVITLATHVFNVLDLRPGRATKAFAGLLIATGRRAGPHEIAPYVAPLLILGAYDLRERAMLGDTGSTLLGALAGLHLTAVLDPAALASAAAGLAVIAVTAELTSLSALIDRIPPLRALDWLGRRKSNA